MYRTPIQQEDDRFVAQSPIVPWEHFEGSTVVITGATGLIGSNMIAALCEHNKHTEKKIKIIALVRSVKKACELFGGEIEYVSWDARVKQNIKMPQVDYILHCAAPTSSQGFIEQPVETIDAILNGTISMLELARTTRAHMVFLSTMETYGETNAECIYEDTPGTLDALCVRNSYPEAKRMAENLCASYASEYDVHVSIARLTQSFGPGVSRDDQRVFAFFARQCLADEDIVLLTDGSKENSYIYTADVITALLVLLDKALPAEAYNVANDDTYCSIKEMASMVLSHFASSAQLRIEIDEKAAARFRKAQKINLSTRKIRDLGWNPRFSLIDMYARLLEDWRARNFG